MIEEAAISYLEESVHDEFSDDEVFNGISPGEKSDAKRNLRGLIRDRLNQLGISTNTSIDSVVDAFDIEERMESYFTPEPDEDDGDRYRPSTESHVDEIDDLFDRSDR